MDMDSCSDANFYDEIASLMPPTNDYNFDDIDEILRSTDSHLDSSINLNSFVPHNVRDVQMSIGESFQQPPLKDDLHFDMPTPFSTAGLSSYMEETTTEYVSQRTSSTSSMDDENFNPDVFMSFLNADDMKVGSLTQDVVMNMPQRNTPSPTGSCTSSSGSSTSGVQSDASSVASLTQTSDIAKSLLAESVSSNTGASCVSFMTEGTYAAAVSREPLHAQTPAAPAIPSAVSASVPITVPVLPMQSVTTTASSILHSLPPMQPINLLPGTIIPVKAMPLTSVTTIGSIKTPMKNEPKLAPKVTGASGVQPMAVKIVTRTTPNNGKITTPTNSKPKTVFLSFNDYKALTQMNGKAGKATNGQAPRIILKTANGKLITANKIVSSGNVMNMQNAPQPHFVPKIVKSTTGPLMVKHHSTKSDISSGRSTNIAAAAARAAVAAASGSGAATSTLSIYKGIIDEKMLKKQQRMIKNRESASLSRKKKKEYVVSLETRINNLEKENYTLKGENSSLRSQLVALAQSCQCKNSNISEFVLNSLNINTKVNGSDHHHVKIAPKPASKSIKQRMMAANVRKNVALLFAMAFMVTLNVGNFQTYFGKNSIESSIESDVAAEELHAGGRRLLWVESETEFKENLVRSKRDTELEVPPLHFLQPINRTKDVAEQNRSDSGTESPAAKCAGGANYTENLRLHSNLHKWIDGNDYLNLSLRENFSKDGENAMRLKYAPEYFASNSFDVPIQGTGPSSKQKHKYFMPESFIDSKQRKLDTVQTSKQNGHDYGNDNEQSNHKAKNSLEIFKPTINDEYLRLFKGIKRQDDTFYVLSFNMDHILLPASAYKKSARPKMSLMLPAGDPSLNGDIVLMQIDCEVVNTTELELKSYMIPEKLRPQKYGAGGFHSAPNPNDVVNNETRSHEQPRENVTVRAEGLKQKVAPRTYFMMGPRSQVAAAALKKKPTLVKLNPNESVAGIATNIKNSTLFARMRETVEGDFKYN